MARTRISPAGSSYAEHGFTLLELLVVMVIVGLLAVSLSGFVVRDTRSLDLEDAARGVVAGLNQVRSDAVFQNSEQRLSIDVDQRKFLAGDTARPLQMREDIRLSVTTTRQDRVSQSVGQIRFFPDGSSTGGRILLTLDGQQKIVEIDWLTGLITVLDRAL